MVGGFDQVNYRLGDVGLARLPLVDKDVRVVDLPHVDPPLLYPIPAFSATSTTKARYRPMVLSVGARTRPMPRSKTPGSRINARRPGRWAARRDGDSRRTRVP